MNQRLDRNLLLAVAGISLYWVSRFFDRGMGVIDEGFVAALSMRIVNGELPYKDFFTLLIPGVFLLHAGLYEVFGPSLWIGRCVQRYFCGHGHGDGFTFGGFPFAKALRSACSTW